MIFDDFYLDIKRITHAHEAVLDPAHRCEYPLGRRHYGFVYALSGQAEYRFFTGERFVLKGGDTLFLAPNAAYSIVTENSFCHYTVNFDIHEEDSKADFAKPYYLHRESARIKEQFCSLVKVWQTKKNGYEMRAVGLLYELAQDFFSDGVCETVNSVRHRLVTVKEYLDGSFNEDITLEGLARMADMSVTNFRREWKRAYGKTPIQYRDSVRLYYAKEYLESDYYTVAEIAERCGFDDASYFVRFFKKKTSLTPMTYKKQMMIK